MEDNNFNRRNFDHDYKNRSRYDENTDSYYETYEEYRREKDINSYIGRSIDDMLRGFNLGGLNDRIQKTVDMAIDEVNRSAVYKMAKKASGDIISPIYEKEIKRQRAINRNKMLDRLVNKPRGLYTSIGFMVPSFVLSMVSSITGVVFYSLNLGHVGIFIGGGALFMLIGGAFTSRIANYMRFKSYTDKLDENGYADISTLAKKTGRPEARVVKDLKKYIKSGNFLEGRLVEDDTIFLASDELYKFYTDSIKSKEKNMEEDKKVASNKELKDFIDNCELQIAIIRDLSVSIENIEVKNKAGEIEVCINNIVDTIKKRPEELKVLDRFTSYYMPTTVKLLESYRDLEANKIKSKDIDKVKSDIEDTLDTIKSAYDKLVAQILETDTMDINSDISVLKTMLSQDGLYKDDFEEV